MNLTDAHHLTDPSLVDRVLRGDNRAFKLIIKNTERLVAQIIFKMVSNDADREDLAQDVYLKVFRNLGSFRFQSKLSTWIAQIAYHTCINYLEKKQLLLYDDTQNSGQDDDDLPASEALALSASKHDIYSNETEKHIFSKELSGILRTEIDKLAPVYKLLITLFHNEELSYAEITAITKLPEGTVKNYLFRARKTLRNNLLTSYQKEAL